MTPHPPSEYHPDILIEVPAFVATHGNHSHARGNAAYARGFSSVLPSGSSEERFRPAPTRILVAGGKPMTPEGRLLLKRK
jgi:hypothetical protein